ncbi:DUF3990 domain-containing protein [Candidatus Dojkabacteria bacterium]|jgi:hypothetical protein|nr:DUF3990 domain-containing protein [Candidatus Dojkabacteria bacterium]
MKYIKSFVLITETLENKFLYHGSNVEFDEFNDNLISTGDSSELFGKGFYLTDNINVAKFYAIQKAKNDKIIKWTHDGILGSPVPHYIISYIKKMGYDGLKYKSDQSYEGNFDSWNYVIYNKNIIKKINTK